ncbi:MAG: TonB-dependent receptor [Ferruginibacter sp.]
MKQLFLLQYLLFFVTDVKAQTGAVPAKADLLLLSGKLHEKLGGQAIANATVSLVNTADSSLVAFTRSDSTGFFLFSHLQPGHYRLSASHTNYHLYWQDVVLNNINTTTTLNDLLMNDRTVLEEVTLHTQRPPVELNGDTLEFNAESFKTKPNAVVEDMLKKMPGVVVSNDGTVSVNGKQINRVLVNGKDFFNGDPKMATRNLSADAVDKVQVFDKASDQAAFTGIDDGNAEKTINLKLKKDKKNAAFGKLTASAGTNHRYDAQFNVNKFEGNRQVSAIGMANNTNRQGFSIMDILNFTGQAKKMMSGGGGMVINTNGPEDFGLPVNGINNNQGLITTVAGGINFADTWSDKTDVNASYFYNDLSPANTRIVSRQNILPGNNYTSRQNSIINNTTQSNRFNFSADQKIDSFNTIKLTSLIGYQKGNAASINDYESFVPEVKKLNSGYNNTGNATEGYNTINTLLYRHKFKKRSRTFSINTSMQYNDSRYNGTQNSINNFFTNGIISVRDTLNQVTILNSLTQRYEANLSYTEPLSKRALIELKAFYNTSLGNLDRSNFDFNKSSGNHDIPNSLLSNAFESRYNYSGAGVSLRSQQKNFGYTAGANFQFAQLTSQLRDSAILLKQYFTNILPLFNLTYNFSKTKYLRLDYNSSTAQPNPSQLQLVKDVSDPLNIVEGNPVLQQSYRHNVGLQFFSGNPFKQNNLFAYINYFATQNAIVNSDKIGNGGTRITTPVNAGGVYYIVATVDRGFRVKKLNTRCTFGGNVMYNRSVNFINDQLNKTATVSFAPRVSANYTYKEIVDINFSAKLGYNTTSYSLQSSLNNNYWRQTYELGTDINLPGGFTISNELTYTSYSGRVNGFNRNVALWNASLSKQVLKSKKGELRISGFDLLKQNIGVERNAGNNYIEDIQYKTLQRFFTAGFTYSLQKASRGGPRAIIRTM